MHLVPQNRSNKPISYNVPLHRGNVMVVEVMVGTPEISRTYLGHMDQVMIGPWGKRILDKIDDWTEKPTLELVGILTPWVIGLNGEEIPYKEICAAALQDGFLHSRGEIGLALCLKQPNEIPIGLRIGMKPCDCERKINTTSTPNCNCHKGILILEPLPGDRILLDGDSGRKHDCYDCHALFAFGVDPRMLS